MNLTSSEIGEIRRILSNQTPGHLPYELFIELSKYMVVPIIELVPLCKDQANIIKVLLLKRPADDPFWPGMVSVPGTIVRIDDKDSSFDEAFQRIRHEIGNASSFKKPVFSQNYNRTSTRSREVAICYWVKLDEHDDVNGKWYRVDDLPKNIVENQIELIRKAVQNFKSYYGK